MTDSEIFGRSQIQNFNCVFTTPLTGLCKIKWIYKFYSNLYRVTSFWELSIVISANYWELMMRNLELRNILVINYVRNSTLKVNWKSEYREQLHPYEHLNSINCCMQLAIISNMAVVYWWVETVLRLIQLDSWCIAYFCFNYEYCFVKFFTKKEFNILKKSYSVLVL